MCTENKDVTDKSESSMIGCAVGQNIVYIECELGYFYSSILRS